MHALFSRFYENADLTTFIKDLSEKSGVIMVRGRTRPRPSAASAPSSRSKTDDDGRPAIGVFSGDTILHPDYWGDRALKDGFVRYMLGVKARMPHTHLLAAPISRGYKTYLLRTASRHVLPDGRDETLGPAPARHRGPVLPAALPRAYNPTKGILDFGRVRSACVTRWRPSPRAARRNPTIAFFEDRNPEWHRGVELPCVGEVSLNLLWPYLARSRRAYATRRRPGTLATELGERMPSLA
ncbi:MAG: hypothetical protein IPI43_32485 [Sandaracinaceae bacterium]|nr:hypothetical protein [Sandaracinaceae bacterium]